MTDSWQDPRSRRWRAVRGHAVLAVLGLLCVFPIYWLYATSLRRPGDVYSLSPLPWPLSWQSYADAASKVDVLGLLGNTTLVAALTSVGQLLTGLLAAYAFAAWEFRLKRVLYLAFVGTWLVPFQVTMLPNYVLLFQLGLLNTLAGVVIPTLCSALGVLLLRQHLAGFPKELLEAARMDGRSSWTTLWTVVVPNLRPALAALAILLFVNAWNEYFWPAMVLRRSNAMLQLGLRSFMGTEGDDWGPLMALAGLACLPVFLLYLVLQRHIVNAFVRSGLR
ncbi:carbohydrate ABC transporter permease [Solihabitans fulvus]|uniref:Carbohydrate ABC transporter permease n=1 Tax=Solihabitans fulvus TaxID=1892852 RepID=A0A5B2XEU4_9PSEU|nr:carbohydrate ABC transporter permease [Solihabitans fulvus]KAA2261431.1 carbohydrate ABC transporter permease [Solihabitans fulvus]